VSAKGQKEAFRLVKRDGCETEPITLKIVVLPKDHNDNRK